MSFTILQATPKRVVMVDLCYPYGKQKVYLSGSLVSVSAQLASAGHDVNLVDFNIDNIDDERVRGLFSRAQIVGVSVVGSPYFPSVISFCQRMAENYPQAQVVLGGQVIRGLNPDEFQRIFGRRVLQVASDEDTGQVFGPLPPIFSVPHQPVWEKMGDARLQTYLEHEFALVLSQGCAFNCHFCAARKGEREEHRDLAHFKADMGFLRDKAKHFGLTSLECYASALDFFQNPQIVAQYMRVLGEVFAGSGVEFRMRALSCMNTFLKASRVLPDFAGLAKASGLWCVGFGVDGPDESVWRSQNKTQNHTSDVADCLNLCEELGVRAELLMVMGYPSDGISILWRTVRNSFRYTRQWPGVVLRPYLAKVLVPGNLGWETRPMEVEKLIVNPQQFFNLDFCALGSPTTHPKRWQRWLANLSYLVVIVGLAPFGKCATSPLFPQGVGGVLGWLARRINRFMPFDR